MKNQENLNPSEREREIKDNKCLNIYDTDIRIIWQRF